MTLAPSSAIRLSNSLAIASRPQNIIFSGLLAAEAAAVSLSWQYGLKIYLLLFCLYAVAATLNNLFDVEVDKLNNRKDNPFSTGALTRANGWLLIVALGLPLVLLQAFTVQPLTISLTSVYLVLAVTYSHRLVSIQSRGFLAAALLAVCYGGIPICLGLASASAAGLAIANLQTVLLIPLLLAKDYKDYRGDKLTGKKTYLVRNGPKANGRLAITIAILASTTTMFTAWQAGLFAKNALLIVCTLSYLTICWHLHRKKGKIQHLYLRASQLSLLGINMILLLKTI